MAQLAVAGAGAAVGFVLGGPVGAQVGWMLGGIAGALLFPPKGENVEGPRLNDLSAQTSAYGVPIALVANHAKLAGNVIWTTDTEERRTTRRQGKGGGGAKITEYSYYRSWAVGLCEWLIPPSNAQVLRIWLDNKLVYDTTGGSQVTQIPGFTWRFYDGNEAQTPDPLIEATVGADDAPAHRGLAYIVFEDVPLERFGNRMPNVTVELVGFAARSFPELASSPPATSIWAAPRWRDELKGIVIDWARGRVYMGLRENGSSLLDGVRVLDLRTLETITERHMVDITGSLGAIPGDQSFADHLALTPGGKLLLGGAAGAGTSVRLFLVDPDSLAAEATYGDYDTGSPPDDEDHLRSTIVNIAPFQVWRPGLPPRQLALIAYFVTSSSRVRIIDLDTMQFVWGGAVSVSPALPSLGNPFVENILLAVRGQEFIAEGYSDCWTLNCPGGRTINLHRHRVYSGAAYLGGGATMGMQSELAGTIDCLDFDASASTAFILGAELDPADGTLIIGVQVANPGNKWLVKWSPESGLVWTTQSTAFAPLFAVHWSGTSRLLGANYGAPSAVLLQAGTGGAVVNQAVSITNGWSQWIYDGLADAVYVTQAPGAVPTVRRVYLNRLAANSLTVGDVVAALCERSGLAPADYDVSELTDGLRGYLLGRPLSARDAITPLAAYAQFDSVEQDDVLHFRKRAGSTVATIPFADQVREDADGVVIEEQRAQDLELPREVTARFMDIERGWEQNAQSWRRPASPTAVTAAVASAGLDLPLPLTASEAKAVARRLCIATWRERTRLSFSVGPKYMRLVPTDPIIVETRDGATVRCRVLNTQLGANWVTRVEAVTEDAAVYALGATADGGGAWDEPVMPGPYYTRLIVPNLALVNDADDLGQAALREYAFAGAYSAEGWRGVVVYRGADLLTWTSQGALTASAEWGTLTAAPAAPVTPWAWDEANELLVYMQAGAPESATALEVLNWANMAALVSPDGSAEIVQWRDAEDLGDGHFRLTGLLRGRRGTEDRIATRALGDLFVILDASRLAFSAGTTEAALTRYHRAVSIYETVDTAASTVTKMARGRAEQPYAPAHVAGSRDGSNNLTVTWVRRTRLGGEWLDGTGTVPVSEAAEAYEVDVMSGATVVRTIAGLSAPTASYSAADQTTDFGSPQAAVTVRVYQLSGVVGRGIPAEAVV